MEQNNNTTNSIEITINGYVIKRENSFPFTKYKEYVINIIFHNNSRQIQRRYSQFRNLHKTLGKRINKLPRFPPKLMLQNSKLIKDRMLKLSSYLNNLFQRKDIYQLDEVFNFLDLEKELFLIYKSGNGNNIKVEHAASFSTCESENFFGKQIFKPKSSELLINDNFFYCPRRSSDLSQFGVNTTEIVCDFLNNLNLCKEATTDIVKKFEGTVFQKNVLQSITKQHMYKLLYGIMKEGEFYNGLIFHIGNLKENYFGSLACLELLVKLIEVDIEGERCIFAFKKGHLSQFEEMNIRELLKIPNQNVMNDCFKIISTILSSNDSINLDKLIGDHSLLKKYQMWMSEK